MSRQKKGNRYRLLVYYRTWNRLWKEMFAIGFLLLILWHFSYDSSFLHLTPLTTNLVLGSAVVCLFFSLVSFIARRLNYVQPFPTHLLLVTPLLRLNISYKRINSVRPIDVAKTFHPSKLSWSQRNTIEPFYGMTGVGVILYQYPLSYKFLRLFIPLSLFLPHTTGICLIVKDWMNLSTEIDSMIASQLDKRREKRKQPGLITDLRSD